MQKKNIEIIRCINGLTGTNKVTGTQLMAARKKLKDIIKNLNQEQLKEYGTEMGM